VEGRWHKKIEKKFHGKFLNFFCVKFVIWMVMEICEADPRVLKIDVRCTLKNILKKIEHGKHISLRDLLTRTFGLTRAHMM
jgi:hypothetical protein